MERKRTSGAKGKVNTADNVITSEIPASEASGIRPEICVWLIEDNHSYRNTMARVVNGMEGINCAHQFSNAEDALDALKAGDVPDLIMLDVQLPGQSGIEAIGAIKSISPSTRIVMLTVFDDHEKVFKAVCAGASGYLLKPSNSSQIITSIREAMSGGAPLTPQVARSVLDMLSGRATPTQNYGLTSREQAVLKLMAEGLIMKEIARQLEVSYHTVDSHLRNIYAKLHVHTSTAAVAKAVKEKLL